MEVYLRARGVASVFMTDDALGAFWSGAWFLNQVGPSSLWQWSDCWHRFPTQLDSENCPLGPEVSLLPGTAERAALLANNNPTTIEPPNGPNETWVKMDGFDENG